jgi:hypothetical protein
MLLLAALLIVCAPLGLRHAHGELDRDSNHKRESIETPFRRIGGVAVQINGGSFEVRDFSLTEAAGSAILKGNLVNSTNRHLDQMTFEVKAYDREGNLLRGVEEKTIFTAHQLEPNADAPIHSGYGVWLQGIPLSEIARVEISETGNETGAARSAQIIPFAGRALFLKEYSEIEE